MHMSDDDIRDRLVAERDRLDQTRRSILEGGGIEDGGEGQASALAEPADADQQDAGTAAETLAVEVDQSLLEQVRSELDDVEVALRRLDEGSYGKCEACGQPIGEARLAAVPTARYCIHHQRVAEAGRGPTLAT